ncbi:hypothetical protein C8R48DRAFT_773343 [Suillus tomentosus]|nr:hypothetical protein C8R48DRAFT_773343 [Suillus tomentosus]
MVIDPKLHYHIGQSEKNYDDIGHYLRSHTKDPAMKDFLPRLKDHILDCLEPLEKLAGIAKERDSILFKRNRIYYHNIAKFNYTAYDVRRAQDVINPRTPHCNIMVLKHHGDDHDDNFRYAKIIGIHHVNIVRAGNVYESRRLEFLHVRWYKSVQTHTWETHTLGRVRFVPLENQSAFDFIDPGVVLRACHIIPAFSRGKCNLSECRISPLAGDKHDWREYYVNSFADRDGLMRFHYGLGVGHVYSHEVRDAPNMTTQADGQPSRREESPVENIDWPDSANNDEEVEEGDYIGVEELDTFEQERNRSTESLIDELNDMFTPHSSSSTMQAQASVPTYLYHPKENKVSRILQLPNEQHPFVGFKEHFRLLGYLAIDRELSPIYRPSASYASLNSEHDVLEIIGILAIPHNGGITFPEIYQQRGTSDGTFMLAINTGLSRPNVLGEPSLVWPVNVLNDYICFNQAQFPDGFPPFATVEAMHEFMPAAPPPAIEAAPFLHPLQPSSPPAIDQEFEAAFLTSVPPSVGTSWPDLDYDFETMFGSEGYQENSVVSGYQPIITDTLVGNAHLPPPTFVFHEHIVWKGDDIPLTSDYRSDITDSLKLSHWN